MQIVEPVKKEKVGIAGAEENTEALTLMDLVAALCEETEDDTLVAAAVIDLFSSGYVKFQDGEKVAFV